jgi:hypothetical protein
VIDTIIIKWPSGITDVYMNVAVNMFITAVENLGIIGINNEGGEIPAEYELQQNYPNPFNPTTNIKFILPNAEMVKLRIFDILGNEVTALVDGFKQAGVYTVTFDASKYATGLYFYTIEAGDFRQTKKMLLVK